MPKSNYPTYSSHESSENDCVSSIKWMIKDSNYLSVSNSSYSIQNSQYSFCHNMASKNSIDSCSKSFEYMNQTKFKPVLSNVSRSHDTNIPRDSEIGTGGIHDCTPNRYIELSKRKKHGRKRGSAKKHKKFKEQKEKDVKYLIVCRYVHESKYHNTSVTNLFKKDLYENVVREETKKTICQLHSVFLMRHVYPELDVSVIMAMDFFVL